MRLVRWTSPTCPTWRSWRPSTVPLLLLELDYAILNKVYRANPEDHNLTMRMSIRRFAPDQRVLEELENHAALVARYFVYCNFARVYWTLRVTPAMEARIGDDVWSVEDIVNLLA